MWFFFSSRKLYEVNVDMKCGVDVEWLLSWRMKATLFFVCFFQIKYRQDFNKMKGAAHYHSLPAQDNLVLKRAQSVNKLVSEVRRGTAPSVCCHLLWFRQTVKGWPQNEKFYVNATWATHVLPVAKEQIGSQKQFITEPRTKLIKSFSDGSEVSS